MGTILRPKAEAGVRPELAQHASPGALLHHEASSAGYYSDVSAMKLTTGPNVIEFTIRACVWVLERFEGLQGFWAKGLKGPRG